MVARYHRAELAAYGEFPLDVSLTCMQVLARDPSLHSRLAENVSLPSPVWRTLWGKRPELSLALLLVSRPLSRPDRDLVLSKETRVRVIDALIEYNVLAADEQDTLTQTASPALASTLLAQPWIREDLRGTLAQKAGGLDLLAELAYDFGDQFDEAHAGRLLSSFSDWGPVNRFRERSSLLRMLLHRRPALLDIAVASGHEALVTAAAGSLYLTDGQARHIAGLEPALSDDNLVSRKFALLALVSNPVVRQDTALAVAARVASVTGLEQVVSGAERRKERPEITVPVSELDDPDQLQWLLYRSLPSEYGPGRPIELAQLARNAHLSDDQRDRVARACNTEMDANMRRVFAADLAGLTGLHEIEPVDRTQPLRERHAVQMWPDFYRLCTDAAAKLGTDPARWDTFLGLLDEYDGSADELLELAQCL